MNLLYIGDIMAEPGIDAVQKHLSSLVNKHSVDVVVAQSENVTNGKGMSAKDMKRLQKIGIDFFTGGNHTDSEQSLFSLLSNPESPVIGPANIPYCPGTGYKYLQTSRGRILFISLMGSKVGKTVNMTNPLIAIDDILEQQKDQEKIATVVNFHGDYSSEKRIIGFYLDGRVSAVIGDHWHVPTADALVLPKGTAHISDVGMCGTLNSSLGVTFDSLIPRWRDGKVTSNVIETAGPKQFNAVLVSLNNQGLADEINHIQIIDD